MAPESIWEGGGKREVRRENCKLPLELALRLVHGCILRYPLVE